MKYASDYDVVVAGAGPAGSTTACLLAKGGLRVALLDKARFPREKTCGDGLTPRAIKALQGLEILDKVTAPAFRCNRINLRLSETVTFPLDLSNLNDLPDYILIHPRLLLDQLLLQNAIENGVQFIGESRVELIEETGRSDVQVQFTGKNILKAALAVIATGASTKLLKQCGLLRHEPPTNLAARVYFENVDLLDDSIMLFFDGIELPGYGWVFPTSPTSANIGCGIFMDKQIPQITQLSHLLKTHPYLKRILVNAKQVGALKGYPLRTDFRLAHAGKGRILVTGEAVGLVNPITGEGIDYALESAGLVSEAILHGWKTGAAMPNQILTGYRSALRKKFSYQLALNHLAHKIYFRHGEIGRAHV